MAQFTLTVTGSIDEIRQFIGANTTEQPVLVLTELPETPATAQIEVVAAAAAPVVTAAPEAPAVAETSTSAFGKLLELLEDEKYEYRTVETLVSKTGYDSQAAIERALVDNGYAYTIVHKRSNNAPMIGLN